ncbi:MAG: hypothetical protein AB8C95_14080 [Phycisphaeraceae bacterium]
MSSLPPQPETIQLATRTQGTPPGQSPSSAPLTPEHHAEIVKAQQRRKKISRAVKVAAFNAWSFAIFAGFSMLFAIFSVTSLIAALALAGLAYNEFRGRRQLLQLNTQGPRTLGINQVICCMLIALYCGLQLFKAITGPGAYAQAIEQTPELASMLEPMEDLLQTATIVAYVAVLIIGVGAQGLTAWYYFSRKRHLSEYLKQTPQWVLDLDRIKASSV